MSPFFLSSSSRTTRRSDLPARCFSRGAQLLGHQRHPHPPAARSRVLTEMEDLARPQNGQEAPSLAAVDEAPDLATQKQLGAGARRVVAHLDPGGIVREQRHAGGFGLDDRADLGTEDLARPFAVEAREAIEDARDQE